MNNAGIAAGVAVTAAVTLICEDIQASRTSVSLRTTRATARSSPCLTPTSVECGRATQTSKKHNGHAQCQATVLTASMGGVAVPIATSADVLLPVALYALLSSAVALESAERVVGLSTHLSTAARMCDSLDRCSHQNYLPQSS